MVDYIKKTELNNLLYDELKTEFERIGFKAIKSKGLLYKKIAGGLLLISYRVVDGYNFKRDQVAWKIELTVSIGFDVVHKWFEKFEHRSKSDYKYYSTYSTSIDKIFEKKVEIDVDTPRIDSVVSNIVSKIKIGTEIFFKNHCCLEYVYKSKNIDALDDLKNLNVRMALENLSIIWILKKDIFEKALSAYKDKLEQLYEVGDPMAKIYLPKLDEIISYLKSIDFNDTILCLDDETLLS